MVSGRLTAVIRTSQAEPAKMSLADAPAAAAPNVELLDQTGRLASWQEANDRPSLPWRVVRSILSAGEYLFGCATLFVGLAVLATLPLLQFMSLGYLLESAGRVARTGHVSAGLIGVRKAARLGGIALGTWLLLWPLRFVSLLANSARLIEPEGSAERFWTVTLWILTILFVLHVVSACLRGGQLRSFFWPRPINFARRLTQRGAYAQARDAVWDFVLGLRLPYYFSLGLRGFLGGLVWLIGPISLLAAGARAPVIGFLGGLLLAIVVLYLPFAQVRFAAENRFRAMFELRALRDHFRRAPVAFLVALVGTLLFALPLYLLKIEIIPREAAWLPSLVFVAFIFPARLLSGWAYARADRREAPRYWLFRWGARPLMMSAALIYAVIVYFTQFTSWHGIASLYEQHAFLVPVPFFGL
jgi:multisubunit Na+/H+ antiporter MnhB subunit